MAGMFDFGKGDKPSPFGFAPRKKKDRNFLYNLYDNIAGIDDGVNTPGERLGKGVNDLAKGLASDTAGMAGRAVQGIKGDLDNLMFEGGAMERPQDVLGYAAAPMAPGVMSGRVANVMSAGGAKPGVIGYHASPHDFDRFSKDARGYGVGDQAFGDGHYFTDTEAPALTYRDRIKKPAINGKSIYSSGLSDNAQDIVWKYAENNDGGSLGDVAKFARDDLASRQADLPYSAVRDYSAIIDELDALQDSKVSMPANMYEVKIDAEPSQFLDLDAPSEKTQGATVYDDFRNRADIIGRKKATQEIMDKGYPAASYRVGAGSRARKDYVVFDEKLISIVKKYGIAGAATVLGVQAQDVQAAMDQGQTQ